STGHEKQDNDDIEVWRGADILPFGGSSPGRDWPSPGALQPSPACPGGEGRCLSSKSHGGFCPLAEGVSQCRTDTESAHGFLQLELQAACVAADPGARSAACHLDGFRYRPHARLL